MALFFDAGWFDARLADRGLTRDVLAAAAGMSPGELVLVFKDQRELSASEVSSFAELLGESAAEVATRAGVSTPKPEEPVLEDRIAQLEARVARLEAMVGDPVHARDQR